MTGRKVYYCHYPRKETLLIAITREGSHCTRESAGKRHTEQAKVCSRKRPSTGFLDIVAIRSLPCVKLLRRSRRWKTFHSWYISLTSKRHSTVYIDPWYGRYSELIVSVIQYLNNGCQCAVGVDGHLGVKLLA